MFKDREQAKNVPRKETVKAKEEKPSASPWLDQDFSKLLKRMKKQTREQSSDRYSQSIQSVDWKKIQFNGRSAEDCKTMWNNIQKHICMERSFKEVIRAGKKMYRNNREEVTDQKKYEKAKENAESFPRKRKHGDHKMELPPAKKAKTAEQMERRNETKIGAIELNDIVKKILAEVKENQKTAITNKKKLETGMEKINYKEKIIKKAITTTAKQEKLDAPKKEINIRKNFEPNEIENPNLKEIIMQEYNQKSFLSESDSESEF